MKSHIKNINSLKRAALFTADESPTKKNRGSVEGTDEMLVLPSQFEKLRLVTSVEDLIVFILKDSYQAGQYRSNLNKRLGFDGVNIRFKTNNNVLYLASQTNKSPSELMQLFLRAMQKKINKFRKVSYSVETIYSAIKRATPDEEQHLQRLALIPVIPDASSMTEFNPPSSALFNDIQMECTDDAELNEPMDTFLLHSPTPSHLGIFSRSDEQHNYSEPLCEEESRIVQSFLNP